MQAHTNTQGNIEGTTQGCAVGSHPHHDAPDDHSIAAGSGNIVNAISGRDIYQIAAHVSKLIIGQDFTPPPFEGVTRNAYTQIAEIISGSFINPLSVSLRHANRQLVDAKETIRRVATLIGPQMFSNRLQTMEQYHQELILHLTAKIGGFLSAMESYDWMANELNTLRSITNPSQSVAENAAAVVREFRNIDNHRISLGDQADHERRVRHDREKTLCEFIKQFGYGGPAQFTPMFEFIVDLTNSWSAELNQRRAQFNVMSGKLGFDIGVVPSWGDVEEAIDNLRGLARMGETVKDNAEPLLFTAEMLHNTFAESLGNPYRPLESKSENIIKGYHAFAENLNAMVASDRARVAMDAGIKPPIFTAQQVCDIIREARGFKPFTLTPGSGETEVFNKIAENLDAMVASDLARVARDAHKSEIEALLEAINEHNARWDDLAKLTGLGEYQSFHLIANHVEEKLKANTEEIIRLSVLDNDKRVIFVRIASAIGLDLAADPDTILARITNMQAELETLRAQNAINEHGGEH